MECHKIDFFSLFYCKSGLLKTNSGVICSHSTSLHMYGPLCIRFRTSNGETAAWSPTDHKVSCLPINSLYTIVTPLRCSMDRAIGHSDGATCNISFEFAQPECPTWCVLVCRGSSHSGLRCARRRDYKVEMRRILLLTVLDQWPLIR